MITIDTINAQQINLIIKALKLYKEHLKSHYYDENVSDVTLNDLVMANDTEKTLERINTLYYQLNIWRKQ